MPDIKNDIPPSCHVYGIKCDKTKEECHEHINKEGEKMEPEVITTAAEPSMRIRINVGISTKGAIKWDTTVEGTGHTKEEVLAESDDLIAEMRKRYPDQTIGE
ncbi:hypothetical protein [uncultured Mediterranean phage uvDeep-CGR2-KM18-C74]|nr:hypothetical protein [uncultured Mediterranean phage uvDeep-CGR2-KM18-C74]